MPDYRLYRLDRFTGHIVGVEEFHAGSDVDAVHTIENRPRTEAMELWQERRKIRRFDAAPDIGAPTPRRSVATL